MNISPTTELPSLIYGILSKWENWTTNETARRFDAVVFKSTGLTGSMQTTAHPEYLSSKFAKWNNRVSAVSITQQLFRSEEGLYEGGILRIREKQQNRWQLLKKLEGNVVSVTKDAFIAHLRENQSDVRFIEVEIELSELPEEERPLAVEGHRWSGQLAIFGTVER